MKRLKQSTAEKVKELRAGCDHHKLGHDDGCEWCKKYEEREKKKTKKCKQ